MQTCKCVVTALSALYWLIPVSYLLSLSRFLEVNAKERTCSRQGSSHVTNLDSTGHLSSRALSFGPVFMLRRAVLCTFTLVAAVATQQSDTCDSEDCSESSQKQEFRPGMAWRSSGSTNAELISQLVANRVITSKHVEEVMRSVDRGIPC